MTILDKIIEQKKVEVAANKAALSISELEKMGLYAQKPNSLKTALAHPASSGIISEFKRQSPSKGLIKENANVVEITTGYAQAGAAGLSVLTDEKFFGGSNQDFLAARKANPSIPMVRKDFMIDAYQIHESKMLGADVILLIAANLSPEKLLELAILVKQLGMETLMEVHDAHELDSHYNPYIDIIGVNNRNLKNFKEENVEASLQLNELIPTTCLKISESCISNPLIVKQLRSVGYHGFLIGESFMKTPDPAAELEKFILESK